MKMGAANGLVWINVREENSSSIIPAQTRARG